VREKKEADRTFIIEDGKRKEKKKRNEPTYTVGVSFEENQRKKIERRERTFNGDDHEENRTKLRTRL